MKSASALIRSWDASDFNRLQASGPYLSGRTLVLRFHGAVPALPESYLASIRRRWPTCWDGVVAIDGGRLLGWAEYGIVPGQLGRADVAACVVDAAQGHGIGAALLAAIVARAAAVGLTQVHVDIAHDNTAARRAWRAATGTSAATVVLVPAVAA